MNDRKRNSKTILLHPNALHTIGTTRVLLTLAEEKFLSWSLGKKRHSSVPGTMDAQAEPPEYPG